MAANVLHSGLSVDDLSHVAHRMAQAPELASSSTTSPSCSPVGFCKTQNGRLRALLQAKKQQRSSPQDGVQAGDLFDLTAQVSGRWRRFVARSLSLACLGSLALVIAACLTPVRSTALPIGRHHQDVGRTAVFADGYGQLAQATWAEGERFEGHERSEPTGRPLRLPRGPSPDWHAGSSCGQRFGIQVETRSFGGGSKGCEEGDRSRQASGSSQLIGPRGGLPTLRADLLKLAALLEINPPVKVTVDQLKTLIRPVLNDVIAKGPASPHLDTAKSSSRSSPATSLVTSPESPGITAQEVHEIMAQQDQRFQATLSQVMQRMMNMQPQQLGAMNDLSDPSGPEVPMYPADMTPEQLRVFSQQEETYLKETEAEIHWGLESQR